MSNNFTFAEAVHLFSSKDKEDPENPKNCTIKKAGINGRLVDKVLFLPAEFHNFIRGNRLPQTGSSSRFHSKSDAFYYPSEIKSLRFQTEHCYMVPSFNEKEFALEDQKQYEEGEYSLYDDSA